MAQETKKRYKILVPTDFSECSAAALRRALELAAAWRGEIALVHVVDLGALPVGWESSLASIVGSRERLKEKAAECLAAAKGGADPSGSYIVATQVLEGPTVESILAWAREHGTDLIVMGTHGRSGLAYDYLGSVAERVARLVPADVLIVHVERPVR